MHLHPETKKLTGLTNGHCRNYIFTSQSGKALSFIQSKKEGISIDIECNMELVLPKCVGCFILAQIAPDVKAWVFSEEKRELNWRTWDLGVRREKESWLQFYCCLYLQEAGNSRARKTWVRLRECHRHNRFSGSP